MKSLRIALVAAVAIASMLAGCQKTKNADSIELKNQVDSVSYALGFFEGSGFNNMLSRMPFDSLDCKLLAQSFAESTLTDEYLNMLRNQFDTLDVNAFMHGFIHQIRFRKGMMDEQMANIVCQLKFEAVKARKQAERDTLAARNLEEGQKFLAENAAKDSVVMLESGLQYKILVAGTGARPTADSRVKVNYEGRLIDGTVFDSSYERNAPATFKVTGVIKGWTEALQLMPVGSKWELYIPSDLAYGKAGGGEKILPNSTLIFTVELLSIEE